MKNKIVLLLVVFITGSSLCLYGQKKSLSGTKVKSVVVYEEKPEKGVLKKQKESETNYDPSGNMLEEIEYTGGKVSKHVKYQYDQDNNKIKETELDAAGKTTKTTEYKYEKGFRVEKVVYDSNKKIKSRKTYQYTTF